MPSLLAPYQGRTLDLRNRIVMAPMTRGRADVATGVQTPLAPTYYRQRAGAGLIVSEGVAISPVAKGGPGVPGLHTEEQRRGWQPVTDAVHEAGGTIYAQLWHVGRMTHPAILGGDTPVAPSAVRIENARIYTADGMLDHVVPHELTTDEVAETVRDFARAAELAIAAGFDGVEIHGANGYLVHQFLADNTNLRGDAYGGSTNARLRFAVEVVEAVAAAVGAERVGLRVSPDNPENELVEKDPAATYRALAAAIDPLGLSYLHISQRGGYEAIADLRGVWSGTLIGNKSSKETPSTPESGTRLLDDGHADLVAIGRLFISNPDLPARIAAGVPLAELARQNVYGGGAEGYTDYPAAETVGQPTG